MTELERATQDLSDESDELIEMNLIQTPQIFKLYQAGERGYNPNLHPRRKTKEEFLQDLVVLENHLGDLQYPMAVGRGWNSFGWKGNIFTADELFDEYWKMIEE